MRQQRTLGPPSRPSDLSHDGAVDGPWAFSDRPGAAWKIALYLGLAWALHGAPANASDAYEDEPEEQEPPVEREPEESDAPPLNAGGLDAPGALDESPDEQTQIERDFQRSAEEDSGRDLDFFWLVAEVGIESAELTAIAGDGDLLFGDAARGGTGLVLGGGGGLRLLYFTLGARGRVAQLDAIRLWSVVGDIGLRVPLGNLEPVAGLGIGYAKVGAHDAAAGINASDIDGLALRLSLGIDYYLGNYFSVGPHLSGELLFLGRGEVPGVAAGRATGAGVCASLVAGFHFDAR